MSTNKLFSFKKSYTLLASASEVFGLLTDSTKIKAWGGGKASVASKVGGKFSMFDGWVLGKVLTYVPGKKLSYTWRASEWAKNVPDSIVNYTLTKGKAKSTTKVALVHSNIYDKKVRDSHASGWDDYFFGPMREYIKMHTK